MSDQDIKVTTEHLRTCEHSGVTFQAKDPEYHRGFLAGMDHCIEILKSKIPQEPAGE